jgi:hypothetical protein
MRNIKCFWLLLFIGLAIVWAFRIQYFFECIGSFRNYLSELGVGRADRPGVEIAAHMIAACLFVMYLSFVYCLALHSKMQHSLLCIIARKSWLIVEIIALTMCQCSYLLLGGKALSPQISIMFAEFVILYLGIRSSQHYFEYFDAGRSIAIVFLGALIIAGFLYGFNYTYQPAGWYDVPLLFWTGLAFRSVAVCVSVMAIVSRVRWGRIKMG